MSSVVCFVCLCPFQASKLDKMSLALKCTDDLQTSNNKKKVSKSFVRFGIGFFWSSVSKNDNILKVVSKNI